MKSIEFEKDNRLLESKKVVIMITMLIPMTEATRGLSFGKHSMIMALVICIVFSLSECKGHDHYEEEWGYVLSLNVPVNFIKL